MMPPTEMGDDITPLTDDVILFIRDGMPILKSPQHPDNSEVPEDFLVMLGVASVFLDPSFRAAMRSIVNEAHRHGMLDGVIHAGRSN
jgi:hypothetical protein